MTLEKRRRRFFAIAMTTVLVCGCTREPSAPRPTATGSSDGYGSSGEAPGKRMAHSIYIETPITSTSRLLFGGYEWKRDPSGSIEGSEDLPEMGDDGIEDSFTTYLTDDPKLRLYYMLTGSGHRIYVREQDKNKWVTMKTLFFQE